MLEFNGFVPKQAHQDLHLVLLVLQNDLICSSAELAEEADALVAGFDMLHLVAFKCNLTWLLEVVVENALFFEAMLDDADHSQAVKNIVLLQTAVHFQLMATHHFSLTEDV
jgi:hypothetical protein